MREPIHPSDLDHGPDIEPSAGTWCLGPSDLAAIVADELLMRRLAAGQDPDETGPTGAIAAAWLREVRAGGAR